MSFWEILSKIVRTILIMSATGSVITLALFIIKPIMKKYLPKSVQYYLWVLVVISFLVPFSSFISLPFNTPMTPVQNIIETNVKSTVEWQNQIAMELYGVPYTQLDAPDQVNVSYREFKARNIGNYNFLLPYILILGVTYFLKEIVQYNIYLFKLKRRRIPARKNDLNLLPDRGPRLFRNPLATTPMLVGLFCPVMYLPDREYSEKQLQNIMLHELIHFQRHDVALKWLAASAVCMHWFNPLANLARREIDKACELACDEAVINKLDAEGKQSYGDTLIEMASDMRKARTIVSTTLCEEKKTLKERLEAIMHSKKKTKLVILLSCVLLPVAFCIIVVFGASANSESAIDALFREYGNESAVIRPQSIITEVNAGDNRIVIFYYNANNNLACAIVERSLLGYTVVKTGAELTVESGTPVSLMSGQYNNANKWRAWGILRNREITQVIIYGQEATIVEADGLHLFYIIGDDKIPEEDYYTFYNNAGELVWEIGATAPQYDEDELMSAMRENTVPDGLTLEITSAASDDAEFLLSNKTDSIVEYGYVNRVEQYIDGAWKIAISETKAIFPENPKSLQAGQQMYGMAAWVRDNTELKPGSYHYLMLVNVRDGDLPAYSVVLKAPFEITE